jgi:hypothetical protein
VVTIETPAKKPIQVGNDPREISAARYLKFNQAWTKETGLGSDVHNIDSALRKLGLFIQEGATVAAQHAYTNLVQGLVALEDAVPLKALVLATVTLRIGDTPCEDLSDEGLLKTAEAILATGIMQDDLVEAVEAVKKNANRAGNSLSGAVPPAKKHLRRTHPGLADAGVPAVTGRR